MSRVLAVFIFLVAGHLRATTYTAASASYADVYAKYLDCSDGDTLAIPAGSATWTTMLDISKAITLQGAGIGQTIITDNQTGGIGRLITWNTEAGKSYRMTGIEFRVQAGKPSSSYGAIAFEGDGTSVRMDHCKTVELSNAGFAVWIGGSVYGVADNCEFVGNGNGGQVFLFQQGTQFGDTFGQGDGSWQNPANWGSANAFFIETCTFSNTDIDDEFTYVMLATDGWRGCRYVFRYNTCINAAVHNHEAAQRYRGGRSMEVYNNTFTCSTGVPESISDAVYIRAGTALVYNNTFGVGYYNAISLVNYRDHTVFVPWFMNDGTMLWDTNGSVAETGTLTATSANSATAGAESWTTNQWQYYHIRTRDNFTATSGTGSSTGTVTVSGAGWTTDQWAGYQVTKLSNGEKGYVSSNTSDTLTLSSVAYRPDFTGGGNIQLSLAGWILSNTATVMTLSANYHVEAITLRSGAEFDIRLVTHSMDMPGSGVTDPITGDGPGPNQYAPPSQDLNQQTEPVYCWDNTFNTTVSIAPYPIIVENTYYFADTEAPGYTPYPYPHPLIEGPRLRVKP